MRIHLKLLILFFSLFSLKNQAQNLGAHPSDIDWQYIDSENVRVIFPKGTDNNAARIADVINYINKEKTISVGEKSRKIDLILQTQQVISNGFVTLGPYRSEFFATPPQDQSSLGSTEWLDLLAVHEYRHSLQYANANRGFTKFMHIIAGQYGWSGALHFSIPSWYLEGDAVLSETLLSENGRGRNPSFFKEQRALLLNDIEYSYMKSRNGSFKDIVPNQYPLGYSIVNHIRNKYGVEQSRKILADAGKYKYILYPFSNAVKKHTGLSTTKLYKETYSELSKNWKNELEALQLSNTTQVSKPTKRTVTNYTFPQYLNDGSILCLKSSYKATPELVQISNNKETSLHKVGISAQEYLSVNNNFITWVEYKKDLRRANKNYSVIVTYDYTRKKRTQLTHKSKLFSPHYSSDGTKIVALNSNENIEHSIVIIDANTGQKISKIPNLTNDFISFPKWSSDNSQIIYIVKKNSKLAFFRYSLKDEKHIQITNWTNHTIGNYSISKNNIYYTASYNGIDNIYQTDIYNGKTIQQITSVAIGAYMPSVSKNNTKIIFSEFSNMGYTLKEAETTPLKSIVINEPMHQNRYAIKTTAIEHAILDSIPENTYNVKDYKGFFRGMQLHSWGLTLGQGSGNTYGLNVQLDNVLKDFSINTGLQHNSNENTNSLFLDATYSKYFVELNLHTSTQYRSVSNIPLFTDNFDETTIGGGFSIPLSNFHNNYSTSFLAEVNYMQHIVSSNLFSNADLNFGDLQTSIQLTNYRRTATQNLGPKFGQAIDFNYYKSLEKGLSEKINIGATLYFPGLLKNHSLNITGAYQKELLTSPYQYADTFAYARGYEAYPNETATKIAFNYQFPVFYPDWGLANITYFKRIRANLFYDLSELDADILRNPVQQNSYGVELMFDNTFFNIAPITLGFRNSWLQNTEPIINTENSVFGFFLQIYN